MHVYGIILLLAFYLLPILFGPDCRTRTQAHMHTHTHRGLQKHIPQWSTLRLFPRVYKFSRHLALLVHAWNGNYKIFPYKIDVLRSKVQSLKRKLNQKRNDYLVLRHPPRQVLAGKMDEVASVKTLTSRMNRVGTSRLPGRSPWDPPPSDG